MAEQEKPKPHPGDVGTAMPIPPAIVDGILGTFPVGATNGLTPRQFAAIHLKVPDSGLAWLDELIGRSRLDDAAERFALALTPGKMGSIENDRDRWNYSVDCYELAAALRRFAEDRGVYRERDESSRAYEKE